MHDLRKIKAIPFLKALLHINKSKTSKLESKLLERGPAERFKEYVNTIGGTSKVSCLEDEERSSISWRSH